jgi:hypothetical protein
MGTNCAPLLAESSICDCPFVSNVYLLLLSVLDLKFLAGPSLEPYKFARTSLSDFLTLSVVDLIKAFCFAYVST